VIQDGSNGNTIANNQVTGRNGNGVFIKAHALPCGSNNAIIGNTITSVYYNSIELGFCAGNRINNNNLREGLDGIWLGYAHDTEIRNNTIVNMRNHGIISGNSRGNTVSGNQIINSNEGLYFFSEPYDNAQFAWLPQGDYRSHSNCLCGNTLQSNAIAVHLQDSTNNQVTNNNFINNGRTFLVQGNSDGNNLQGFAGSGSLIAAHLWRVFDNSAFRW
jgi:parallel beta-helix repeat protein